MGRITDFWELLDVRGRKDVLCLAAQLTAPPCECGAEHITPAKQATSTLPSFHWQIVRFAAEQHSDVCPYHAHLFSALTLDLNTKQVKTAGAAEEVVTAEGYTKLPEAMRLELGVDKGGMVWFVKDERGRWAAWTTVELDRMFGFPEKEPTR